MGKEERRRRAEPVPGAAHLPEAVGAVEAIFVTPRATETVREVESVRAEAGRGLAGDRYFDAAGTWSAAPGGGREITLIDAAALEVAAALGVRIAPGAHRRNVVTRGVALLELIGKRFWVGEALCEGVRDCAPCGHMERLSGAPGARAALEGRGGLRAEIRASGTIRRGDAIRIAG